MHWRLGYRRYLNLDRLSWPTGLITGKKVDRGFDSAKLTWFLSKEKSEKVVERCLETANASHVDLKTTEKLIGSVNNLSQKCKTVCFHKRAGSMLLRSFCGNYTIVKMVPADLKEESQVITRIAESAKTGLPLVEEPCQPTLSTLVIYSDAAGASFSRQKREKVFHNNKDKGVACIGEDCFGDIWGWCRLSWPKRFGGCGHAVAFRSLPGESKREK